MYVPQIGPVSPPSTTARPKRAEGEGFAAALQRANALTPAVGASAVVTAGLLGLSVEDDREERDRRARQRAGKLLAGLSRIQLALLNGRVDAAMMTQLADLAGLANEADDPALKGLVDSITLRVKVELARLSAV